MIRTRALAVRTLATNSATNDPSRTSLRGSDVRAHAADDRLVTLADPGFGRSVRAIVGLAARSGHAALLAGLAELGRAGATFVVAEAARALAIFVAAFVEVLRPRADSAVFERSLGLVAAVAAGERGILIRTP